MEGLAPADCLLMPTRLADKGMDMLFPNTRNICSTNRTDDWR